MYKLNYIYTVCFIDFLKKIYLLIYLIYESACMCWLVNRGILTQLKEQSTQISLLFHHVSSGDWTKVIWLDNNYLLAEPSHWSPYAF